MIIKQLSEAVGKLVAKRLFDKRSKKDYRNVEVHVTEEELATLVALGAQLALEKAGYGGGNGAG